MEPRLTFWASCVPLLVSPGHYFCCFFLLRLYLSTSPHPFHYYLSFVLRPHPGDGSLHLIC